MRRKSVAAEFSAMQCLVVPVNDLASGYDYPAEVRFEIAEQDLPSYLRAADFLNITDVDVVCVEHEFGIFGGPAGSHLLALLPRPKYGFQQLKYESLVQSWIALGPIGSFSQVGGLRDTSPKILDAHYK